MIRKILVFLMVLFLCPVFSQNSSSIEDTKKQAAALFEAEDYTKAYQMYSQLVANFPKDPEYNFKLGVCMIYSEPDKKKCLPYLQFAAKNTNEQTKDVLFYLGKGFHINYQFDEAIKNYSEYKKTASAAKLKKLAVDREIKACNNGKRLLSNLTDLEVKSKKELNEADYFRSYDLSDIGGKLLVRPEDFSSSVDKKKKDQSVMFLPKTGNKVYYSSYGNSSDNGKDIYYAIRLADGSYSEGKKVSGINTEFDEDYPFIHPNGQTMYFASKGHNGMGGYDIFKSTYIEASDSWTQPVNMEFPINSPDDDYLFVTDSLEKNAYFTTGRQSPPGKTDVLKISTERKPIDVLVIKGKVNKDTEEQSVQSKITVKVVDGDKDAGTFYAGENGNYQLNLQNGAKVLLTVETPGFNTQTQEITLPMAETSKPYSQTIAYNEGILKITNNFDEPSSDDDYLQYLKVIEKKAKLDVNEGENKLSTATAANIDLPKKNESSPELVGETIDSTATKINQKPGLDNNQLSAIAKEDAVLSKNEAVQLKQDSNDALEVGKKQKEDAAKKLAAADVALKNAEALEDSGEKKSALDKAQVLKQEAENEDALANKVLAFGAMLEADASAKEKEASLNEQYAIELDKAINSNPKDNSSTEKLAALQNEINSLSAQKNTSEKLVNTIKTATSEKEQQVLALEKTNADIKSNLEEIKTEISANETDLANTRKKKDKQIIIDQTTELKSQQAEKETQITNNDVEIKKLNDELIGLRSELDIANKIKNETIAPVIEPVMAADNSRNIATAVVVPEKKSAKTVAAVSSKTTSSKAKEPIKPDYTPLSASTPAEAALKLDKLAVQLNNNDNELFEYNDYQNEEAQKLRIEADTRINDAVLQQKKLKDLIASSKGAIGNTGAQNFTPQQLSKEADDLSIKAQGLRTEAAKLTGQLKTKKIAEANALEKTADEKYLQAAEVTKNDNRSVFETNQQNLALLFSENATDTLGNEEARSLNDEAKQAFKKADEIRAEALLMPSAGARLGNLSNAEEIEAAALQKQQQAVDFLTKSNPTALLKVAVTSANPVKVDSTSGDVNQKLETVNEGVKELANIKLDSYQKLIAANDLEVQETLASIAKNQAILDKIPGLKSDFIAGSAKMQTVADLKSKSDSGLSTNERLANMTSALRKQLEAIKQLNALNASLTKAAAKNEVLIAKQNQQTNTIVADNNDAIISTNTEIIDTVSVANVRIIDAAELITQDTTAAQLIGYFNTNTLTLNNSQARAAAKKSLETINNGEEQIKIIENKINNPNTVEAVETNAEMKSKSNALLVEAEILNTKAFEAIQEAGDKTGEEKQKLLATATGLENQSTKMKLEAAQINEDTHKAEYESNYMAIEEMLMTLKNDNAELFAETNSSNKDLLLLAEKAKKLREETDSQTNNAARLGAISNAEEKEAELSVRQRELIATLKKQYPNYEIKSASNKLAETPESLSLKRTELREKQYSEFTNLTNSFSLDFESSKNNVPLNLSVSQKTLKKNAEDLNVESKRLLIEASQETDENKKIKLFAQSAKSGQAAVEQLSKLIPKQSLIAKVAPKPKSKTNSAPVKNKGVVANNKKAVKADSNSDPYAALSNLNAGTNNTESDSAMAIASDVATSKPAKKKASKTVSSKNNSSPKKETAFKPERIKTPAVKNVVTKSTVKIEGLEVTQGNAYNENRPIPVDSKIEDGLVFRVQIGAFKTRLANDAFKGLSPLNGETVGNGYIRYTAGNFNKVENANAVKNDLRRLGYKDAFVVVYFNGKRIGLNEALSIMEKEGRTIDNNAPETAGINADTNIPKIQTAAQASETTVLDNTVVVTKELEEINGLLYTVQIGVYTKQITRRQLQNLTPIFTERLSNGLFRYTAGIYNNAERLVIDKRKVVDLGVKDAFVSAYLNGKRIPFADGKTKQAEDSTVIMEAENPIVFEGTTELSPQVDITNNAGINVVRSAAINTVQPFKNNVNQYPEATPENGIKITEEGVTYKVQIGAYSKQVPNDVAAKYSAITTWPIENKQIKGLFIYNIGSFSSAKFAKVLKDEAIRLGITDAFISVYEDGVKLYGAAASAALAQ